MKNLSFCLYFMVFVILGTTLGAPYRGEDDEYEDDPEYSNRKQDAMQKLKEQLEKQGTALPTTTIRSQRLPPHGIKQKKKWMHAKDVRGYQILSDGPKIHTEFVRTRPMLRIQIDAPGAVRDVEKTVNKRYLELKIRTWDKVQKVHVKVPFGYQPEELRVAELRDHIEIVAPVFFDLDEHE